MKNQLFPKLLFLVLGLIGGYFIGSTITKNEMEEKTHDAVVIELSQVADEIQNAATDYYSKCAYNYLGEFLGNTNPVALENAESVRWFISDFLEKFNENRKSKSKLFTIESEKEIREGNAIPMPYNRDYFFTCIKRDSDRLAQQRAEQGRGEY